MQFQAKIKEHIQQIITATSEELMALRARQISEIPRYGLKPDHCVGAKIVSNRSELITMMEPAAVVAELGADKGDFSDQILQIATPHKLIIVDAWHTERYGEEKATSVTHRFSRQIELGQVEIVRSLSVAAAAKFEESYFDWIYIDTDHSYKTTLAELFAYERTVKRNGFVIPPFLIGIFPRD